MLDQYWAALSTDEIGEQLQAKVDAHNADSLITSLGQRWSRAYNYYFGLDPSGVHATSRVLRGGDAGELAEVRVNHSRSLVNTLLNLIVANKLVWQPKAVNIDYDSVRECNLAAAILEYYFSEKHVNKHAVAALEEAIVFAEGFVLLEWDETAGDDYAAEDAEPVEGADPLAPSVTKTGDVRFTNVSPWDVIRDTTKRSWDACDWVIVRQYRNRWDLAKQHPEHAADITSGTNDNKLPFDRKARTDVTEDDVPVYYFFHKRTAALPNGRESVFLGNKTVLRDTELTYESMPLYRVSAGEMVGTPYGYTSFSDILGVQEVMDSLHTSVASNQTTLATQCIAVQEGSDIDPQQLAGGMKVIYYQPGTEPPAALQLLRTPSEVFTHLQNLKKEQELLFGLNSVVRGEPQSGEMSGSALALLQSQALQQSSTIQANYLRFVEGLGTCLLSIIKNRASIPKKIAIVGKNSQFLVTDAEYTGESIGRIRKVQVEIGNPLSQTSAGRIELAKMLMTPMGPDVPPLIKSTEQFLQVLQTGRLEPLTQSLNTELLLIKSENESLSRAQFMPQDPMAPPVDPMTGMPVEPQLTPDSLPPVLLLDDHKLHMREHRSVLANPEARRNPAVARAVLQHIAEHEKVYMSAPPSTLLMVGQEPPPMPMMPPGPPGMGPPQGPGPLPPGVVVGGAAAGPPPPAPPGDVPGGGKPPKMPAPPKNPATGQKWNPVDGGGAVPK